MTPVTLAEDPVRPTSHKTTWRRACATSSTIAACAAFAACSGLPVTVHRLDPTEASTTQGIRYQLKKPVYDAAAWASGKDPAFDPAQRALGNLELRIKQRFVDADHYYEIRPYGRVFSDTEAAVVLGESLVLKGFTGGDKDRLGETLTAVAGLAVAAAAAGAAADHAAVTKFGADYKDLIDYIEGQRARQHRLEELDKLIEKGRAGLTSGVWLPAAGRTLEVVRSLDEERTRLKKEIDATVLPLGPDRCRILIGSIPVTESSSKDPWFEVTLNPDGRSPS